jgi:hypothetical protein
MKLPEQTQPQPTALHAISAYENEEHSVDSYSHRRALLRVECKRNRV